MSAELGIIVGVLLAAVAVFLVTRPLRTAPAQPHADETRLADLLAQREAAYQVLRDLDSDFQIGKLSEDDYRPMRVQALAAAAEVVAQLDALEQSRAQQQQAATRKRKPRASAPAAPLAFCPQCGTAHAPDDAFCRKCGRALKEAKAEA